MSRKIICCVSMSCCSEISIQYVSQSIFAIRCFFHSSIREKPLKVLTNQRRSSSTLRLNTEIILSTNFSLYCASFCLRLTWIANREHKIVIKTWSAGAKSLENHFLAVNILCFNPWKAITVYSKRWQLINLI